jgi:hypothetical protein
MPEPKTETFCGVCRHPTPGHEPNCPVYTGEPVSGAIYGIGALAAQQEAAIEQENALRAMMGSKGTGDSFRTQCPYCGGINGMHSWAGSGGCPGTRVPLGQTYEGMIRQGKIPLEDGYEVAKIYQQARERLLEELKAQVEVNRLLCRDLLEARLKLAEFKLKYKIVE